MCDIKQMMDDLWQQFPNDYTWEEHYHKEKIYQLLSEFNFDLSIESLCRDLSNYADNKRFVEYLKHGIFGVKERVLAVLFKDSVWDVCDIKKTIKSKLIYFFNIDTPLILEVQNGFKKFKPALSLDEAKLLYAVLCEKYMLEGLSRQLTFGVEHKIEYTKTIDEELYEITFIFVPQQNKECNLSISINCPKLRKKGEQERIEFLEDLKRKKEERKQKKREEEDRKRREAEEQKLRDEEERRKVEEAKKQSEMKYKVEISKLL